MQRYFVSAEQFNEHSVVITGDDARHIGKVMRGKPGDKLIVSDGNSKEALVEIESIEAQQVTANIVEPLEMDHEARIRVTVAQSLPKGDKMETVIQRCTEIGAVSFVPFLSERRLYNMMPRKKANGWSGGGKSPRKPLNKAIGTAFHPSSSHFPGKGCYLLLRATVWYVIVMKRKTASS